MGVSFCVPASPPNPSRGRPSCISAALLCILTPRKTRLNRGDLGPTPGMIAGRKMGWHKGGISRMGPSVKLGPPKITFAKEEMCARVGVCVSSIRTLIWSQRDSPLVFQQLQHRVLEGEILNLSTYSVLTHTNAHWRAEPQVTQLLSVHMMKENWGVNLEVNLDWIKRGWNKRWTEINSRQRNCHNKFKSSTVL